jgi:ABC-type antimicrobial peptide transport system permease subunit
VTDELWVDGHTGAVHRPPLSLLDVESRAALLRQLRSDPLARGSLLVLVAAAVVALLLALAGLLLGVVADVRDERGELFDLEAQGAAPRTLQRHLRLRTLLVATAAAFGGIVTGAILATLVVRVVSVTAQATAPQPPLRLALDWPVLALAAAAYVAAAAAIATLATRGAFRARVVRRQLA